MEEAAEAILQPVGCSWKQQGWSFSVNQGKVWNCFLLYND